MYERDILSLGTCSTSRSTSVVLPAPDGADTMNSSPRPRRETRPSVSKGLALSLSKGYSTFCTCSRIFSSSALAAMISSETFKPSAFEPIVLTSRFISCSRKSSFLPTGSATVGERYPVQNVSAEPRHLLADVRPRRHPHDLLRNRRLVGLQLGPQFPDAVGDPLLHRSAPWSAAVSDALDQVRDAIPPHVEIGPHVIAFARAHRIEIDQCLIDRRAGLGRNHCCVDSSSIRLTLADRDGLRQAQQVPGRQLAGDQPPRARLLERSLKRAAEVFVELDFDARASTAAAARHSTRRGRSPRVC